MIVSVPSALHSQKPSLSGQISQHFPPEGNVATSLIVIHIHLKRDEALHQSDRVEAKM